MKVLLLGATGRTGKLMLEEAIRKNYRINCLVRNANKITVQDDRLSVFQGTPAHTEQLADALEGCQAIVSALNISRTSDFPWAALRTPETFLSDVMRNILSLAKDRPLKRIVVCSAWGVSDTKADLPGWFRWFIDHSNIGAAYKDHERQEALLMNSGLPWTLVRPSGLTHSGKPQQLIVSYGNEPRPRLTISRMSVARYLIDAIENESLIHKAPVLSAK